MRHGSTHCHLLRLAEGLIFASAEPVSREEITRRLSREIDIDRLITQVKARHAEKGNGLIAAAGGWYSAQNDVLVASGPLQYFRNLAARLTGRKWAVLEAMPAKIPPRVSGRYGSFLDDGSDDPWLIGGDLMRGRGGVTSFRAFFAGQTRPKTARQLFVRRPVKR